MNVTKECKNIYLGNTPIKKVFAGKDLVWEKDPWKNMKPFWTSVQEGYSVYAGFEVAQIVKDKLDANPNLKTSYADISTEFSTNLNRTIKKIEFHSNDRRYEAKEFFAKYQGMTIRLNVNANTSYSAFDAGTTTFKLKSNNDANSPYIFIDDSEIYFEPFSSQEHDYIIDSLDVKNSYKDNLYLRLNTISATFSIKETSGFKQPYWEDFYKMCREAGLRVFIFYN